MNTIKSTKSEIKSTNLKQNDLLLNATKNNKKQNSDFIPLCIM